MIDPYEQIVAALAEIKIERDGYYRRVDIQAAEILRLEKRLKRATDQIEEVEFVARGLRQDLQKAEERANAAEYAMREHQGRIGVS